MDSRYVFRYLRDCGLRLTRISPQTHSRAQNVHVGAPPSPHGNPSPGKHTAPPTPFDSFLPCSPLQNNLVELFSLLSFVLPEIFTDVDLFKNLFDFESSSGLGSDTASKASFIASQLHEILKPFMLRRLKKDVETSLPLKKESVQFCRETFPLASGSFHSRLDTFFTLP